MAKKVTIEDVAREAGVSTMTVSRAINNKDEITEETRQKVLQVANRLRYRPSRIARSLATKKTFQIGLVIPDIRNPFFSQIALGSQTAAWEANYNLLLLNTMEDQKQEALILDFLVASEVDGIILCSSRLVAHQLEEKLKEIPPIVLIGRKVNAEVAGTVLIRDDDGAMQAINHLIENGRKHIACLTGPPQSSSGSRRKEGYFRALETAGISIDEALVVKCEATPEGGETACSALLSQAPYIDGIFCHNDLVAAGAIQACRAMGKSIPEDVAIIGVDDISLARLIEPKLTTLKSPAYEVGTTAFEMLMDVLQGKKGKPEVLFDQTLIVRESAP
jgi:LacI family transcriptional regulator